MALGFMPRRSNDLGVSFAGAPARSRDCFGPLARKQMHENSKRFRLGRSLCLGAVMHRLCHCRKFCVIRAAIKVFEPRTRSRKSR